MFGCRFNRGVLRFGRPPILRNRRRGIFAILGKQRRCRVWTAGKNKAIQRQSAVVASAKICMSLCGPCFFRNENWFTIKQWIRGGFADFGLFLFLLIVSNDTIVGDWRAHGIRILIIGAIIIQDADPKTSLTFWLFFLDLITIPERS